MSDWIEIGKIVAAQGLRGEVRVLSYSDFPERFLEPGERWLRPTPQTQPAAIALLNGRAIPGKNLYIVRLEGITNRDQAEALRGAMLLVSVSDRPPLAPGEFHVSDLVGLEVIHHQTQDLIGTVVDVFAASQDILAVQRPLAPEAAQQSQSVAEPAASPSQRRRRQRKPKPTRPPTVLIPFVKAIVPIVDLARRRLEVLPPLGLLADETTEDEQITEADSAKTLPDPQPGD
ncbi:MAG: ribosome maturation factor RimM [Cyanobacteria bacterium P01_G01_bin.54]